MKRISILIIVLALAACASPAPSTPPEELIQTAIAQTQTAIPTQTPIPSLTPIPLSEIDLESILLINGDLPPIFEGGQVKSKIPKMFEGVPAPDQSIQQEFRAGEFASDGVLIFLYSSVSDLDNAYGIVTEVVTKDIASLQPISDLGEKANISEKVNDTIPLIGGGNIPGSTSVKVVFSRCHVLVYIDLFSPEANIDTAITYAQRLDKRLEPLVCP